MVALSLPGMHIHENGNRKWWHGLAPYVLGAFIQALFWTGGLLVGMGRNAQKNDEWEKWRTEATAADRIHDSYGSKIENNISALARHEQRLDKAESQLAKIDVMASQISRIETDVHDLKQQHNGNK